MKFFDLIKNRKEKSPEVLALEEQFAAIEKITDPGERIVRSAEILEEACRQRDDILSAVIKRGTMLLAGGMFTGVGMGLLFSVVGINLFAAGVIGFLGGGVLAEGMKHLVYEKNISVSSLRNIEKKAEAEIRILQTQQDPLSFAASPYFDNLMEKFPKLKEKFMLASAKEAALEKRQPQLPAPKPPEQGFRF